MFLALSLSRFLHLIITKKYAAKLMQKFTRSHLQGDKNHLHIEAKRVILKKVISNVLKFDLLVCAVLLYVQGRRHRGERGESPQCNKFWLVFLFASFPIRNAEIFLRVLGGDVVT